MVFECRDDCLVVDEVAPASNVGVGQRPVQDNCIIGHAEAIKPRPWDEATGDEPSPFSALFQSHRCRAIRAFGNH
jgi:hypothetical protein